MVLTCTEEVEKMSKMMKEVKSHDATYQALIKVLRELGDNATAGQVQELEHQGIT